MECDWIRNITGSILSFRSITLSPTFQAPGWKGAPIAFDLMDIEGLWRILSNGAGHWANTTIVNNGFFFLFSPEFLLVQSSLSIGISFVDITFSL